VGNAVARATLAVVASAVIAVAACGGDEPPAEESMCDAAWEAYVLAEEVTDDPFAGVGTDDVTSGDRFEDAMEEFERRLDAIENNPLESSDQSGFLVDAIDWCDDEGYLADRAEDVAP
jgi:hypothetical protein